MNNCIGGPYSNRTIYKEFEFFDSRIPTSSFTYKHKNKYTNENLKFFLLFSCFFSY